MYYTDTLKFHKFNFFGFLERERYEKTTTNLMIKNNIKFTPPPQKKNKYMNEKY